jgi:hypothetical protein
MLLVTKLHMDSGTLVRNAMPPRMPTIFPSLLAVLTGSKNEASP